MSTAMDEIKTAWTRAQLDEAVYQYMLANYGRPNEMETTEEKDRWRERYGLLVDLVNCLWNNRVSS